PVDIYNFSKMRKPARASTNLRAGLIRFQRCSWGVEPVRRDQQANRFVRMRGVYAAIRQIASQTAATPQKVNENNDGRSTKPADLFLGHHPLDVLGLALDAVTRAPVRLDRQ